MDLFDRIYRLDQVLRRARYAVPRAALQEKLECSAATVKRIINEMRLYLGAPIEYDRTYRGYRYLPTADGPYELPGLWFNASELYALLTAQQLLANAQPGLLDASLAPLRERIERILQSRHLGKSEIARRIRILRMGARRLEPAHFQAVAGAVLQRKRLRLVYHGRTRDRTSEREISPQRLVHYRDNWYLDAWDHGKRALRSFAVDRIKRARTSARPVREIPDTRLDGHFAGAYGIFAGKPKHKAVLRFTPERARWVADERWHPAQEGRRCADGRYELRIPYADPRELVMDILKYGADVEVLAPAGLRRMVAAQLRAAVARYGVQAPVGRAAVAAGTPGRKRPAAGTVSLRE